MDNVLVDTSVWIEFLTRTQTLVATTLRRLLDQDAVCLTGIVIAELLHGSRTDEEAERLLAKFRPLTCLETPREAWVLAGRTAAALRRHGLTLPLSDVVLAAVARIHGCAIYTTDAHFARIPHVKRFQP